MDDSKVGISANFYRALSRIQSHDLRGVRAELQTHLIECQTVFQHAVCIRQRHQGLESRHSHRDLRPVTVPHRFLLARERARVSRYDRHLSIFQTLPQPLAVSRLLQLRTAREKMAILTVENRIVEHEVLRTRLRQNGDTTLL